MSSFEQNQHLQEFQQSKALIKIFSGNRYEMERDLVRSLFVPDEHHRYGELMARLESRGDLYLVTMGQKDAQTDEGGATATSESCEAPPPPDHELGS